MPEILENINDTNTEQTVDTNTVVDTEVDTNEDVAKQVQKETFYKSFKTEEEWKNYEQILNNKYATNVLKEFNVSSVKELQDTISNYKNQLTALQNEITGIKTTAALSNVNDEYKDDALTIAQAKVAKNPDLTLEAAINEVLTKNPTWGKGSKIESLGTEKSTNTKSKNTDPVLEAFLKRNPQLRDTLLKED